jgi:hypothetical protein
MSCVKSDDISSTEYYISQNIKTYWPKRRENIFGAQNEIVTHEIKVFGPSEKLYMLKIDMRKNTEFRLFMF